MKYLIKENIDKTISIHKERLLTHYSIDEIVFNIEMQLKNNLNLLYKENTILKKRFIVSPYIYCEKYKNVIEDNQIFPLVFFPSIFTLLDDKIEIEYLDLQDPLEFLLIDLINYDESFTGIELISIIREQFVNVKKKDLEPKINMLLRKFLSLQFLNNII